MHACTRAAHEHAGLEASGPQSCGARFRWFSATAASFIAATTALNNSLLLCAEQQRVVQGPAPSAPAPTSGFTFRSHARCNYMLCNTQISTVDQTGVRSSHRAIILPPGLVAAGDVSAES
jgi:hypothetical protein